MGSSMTVVNREVRARAMNHDELAACVRRVLHDIAPEADAERLNPRLSFRDQLDMDSVDYLNFVLALESKTGVSIPDKDYPKLSTLGSCVAYLERAFASAPVAAVAG